MGTRFEAAGSMLDALLPPPCLRGYEASTTTTSSINTSSTSIMKITAAGAACVGAAAADVRRGVWGVAASQPPPQPLAPPAAATTAPAAASACVAAGVHAPLRVPLSPAAAAAAMDVAMVDPVCDEVLDEDDMVDTLVCTEGEGQLGLVRQDSQGSVRAGDTSSSSNRADSSSRNVCTTTTSTVHRLHTYNTPPHKHTASYYVPSYMQQQSSTPAVELRLYRRPPLFRGTICGKSVSDLTMLDFSTYGMDRMKAMESREKDYTAPPTYAKDHPQLAPDFRTSTLAWMMEKCAQFGFRRRTYQLSVNLFERYLSRVDDFPGAKLKLLAATSLFIAAKIEELTKQFATTFASATDGACSATDIRSFETEVLVSLGWITNTPTLDEWLGCYILRLLKTRSRSAAPTTTHAHPHAHSHTHDLPLRLDPLFDIVDLAIFDDGCLLNFFPRQIAAAALYLVTPRHMHGLLAESTGQSPGERHMDCLIRHLSFFTEGMEEYEVRVRDYAWDTGLQTDNRALLAQLYRRQEASQTQQFNALSLYMEESTTYAGELTEDDDDVSLLDDHDDSGSSAGRSFEEEVHPLTLQQQQQPSSRSTHHQPDGKLQQPELHAPSHSRHQHGHQHLQQQRQQMLIGGGGGLACRLEFGGFTLVQRGYGGGAGAGGGEEDEERESVLSDGSVLSDESVLSDDPLVSTDACAGSCFGDGDAASEHEGDSLLDDDDVESEAVSLPGSFSESEPDSESEDGDESGCEGASDARAVCGGVGGGLECLEDNGTSTQDTVWSFDSVDHTCADTRAGTFVEEAIMASGLSRTHTYTSAHTHTYTQAHTQNHRDMRNDSPCSVASDATCRSSSPFGGARVGGGDGGVESAESGKLRATDTGTRAEGLRLSHVGGTGDGRDHRGMSLDVSSATYDPHEYTTTTTEGPFTSRSSASASFFMSSYYGFLPSPSPPLLLSAHSSSLSSIATIAPPSTAPGAAVHTHTHTATHTHTTAHNHTAADTHSMSAYTRTTMPAADAHTHKHTRTLKRSHPMSGSWSASLRTRARYMSSS